MLDAASAYTGEAIEDHRIGGLPASGAGIVANLRWLLSLGAYRDGRAEPVVVRER